MVLEKIYHKFINHYVQPNLENTKFDFSKYSLIRNKFEVRWNKKKGLYMTILITVNKNMCLMRERNVFQRLVFYTQKQLFDYNKKTKNNHFKGYIFYVFLPIIWKLRYLDIHL